MPGNSLPSGKIALRTRPLPRRRPVGSAPGVYYRPRQDGSVGPPYEFAYLDLTGHRRWRVVHAPLEQAIAEQARHRQRRRTGLSSENTAITFERFASDWLERKEVRPRTADRYRWGLEQHLLPRLGPYPIDAIDAHLISRLIDELRRNNLKGWTISTALQPLTMILNDAVRKGHIASNPVKALDRHELPRHRDQRPRRILNLDEMQRLLAATKTARYRCLLELLLAGGLRIGEALGLTAADLDTNYHLIHVRQQLSRHKTRDQLKTPSSQRVIDLPPQLVDAMQVLLRGRDAEHDPDALVFASRNGTGLERKVCREALNRAAQAANLSLPHPTLHDLRHSHASMLIALDYPLADVQHRLGHAKPDTTLRTYTHQWHHRTARRSTIGNHLSTLLAT
jgi:integrase